MPLFSRHDGTPIEGLAPVRRFMPYLMRTRNESVVYYEEVLDLSRTLPFIARWNAEHAQRITVFHLVVAAIGRVLHARTGLNRFVSGGHIYQRNGVQLSFAAKKSFDDDAPIVTVKLPMPEHEKLEETVARIYGDVKEGRTGGEKQVDKELKLALAVPGPLLSAVMALMRLLDRWNLMPRAMLDPDPMYASMFIANLGSLKLDRAFHHLYEYGTVSLFCVIGEAKKSVVVIGDRPEVRDTLSLRFTLDERINDGFYCARSLGIVRELVESPERLLEP